MRIYISFDCNIGFDMILRSLNKLEEAHYRIAVLELNREEWIITHQPIKNQVLLTHKPSFWLHFHFNGDGVEWQDYSLPIPNYLCYANRGYFIAWQIDGYFGTKRGIEYVNDVIARVLVSFAVDRPQRLLYKPNIKEADHYYPRIRRLQEFVNLKSLSSSKEAPVRADSYTDYMFWAIKLYTEDLIRSQGIVSYQQLESFAYSNFESKERSTLRAKCRSIFNWYEKRGWKLPKYTRSRKTKTDKELQLTRQERAKQNTKERAEKARSKVLEVVTGLLAPDYRKKSGSWHIGKIAKDTSLSSLTVSKYLKQFTEEGIIE